MRNVRIIAAGLTALSGLALLAGCASNRTKPPAGLAGQSASQIVAKATAAATAASWVHANLTAKAGSASITSSGVTGPNAASETTAGAGHAAELMIAGVGYARGSSALPVACVERVSTARVSVVFSQWGRR